MEDRLIELELRTMEQQKTLQELSDAMYAQQKTIDRLEAEVTQLKKRLAAEPGLVDASVNERPPHH